MHHVNLFFQTPKVTGRVKLLMDQFCCCIKIFGYLAYFDWRPLPPSPPRILINMSIVKVRIGDSMYYRDHWIRTQCSAMVISMLLGSSCVLSNIFNVWIEPVLRKNLNDYYVQRLRFYQQIYSIIIFCPSVPQKGKCDLQGSVLH